MSLLTQRLHFFWSLVQQAPAQPPTCISIPHQQVNFSNVLGSTFQGDKHYFQVRVNEMFLASEREWFSQYDPLVFVISEFIYDNKIQVVPFIVGPALLENKGQQAPVGMIFSNTRVAGLHPYKGGRLTLSVILGRVQRGNYARELLKLVESTSSALDFSTALTSYTKIAGVLLDGLESLFGLGGTQTIVGLRKEFDPAAGDKFEPGYFVLIDQPQGTIDTRQLWVRDHQLVYGNSLPTAQPFRQADYVLYSIIQTSERSDEVSLPFYPLYKQVKDAATKPDPESWKRAKANMLTLYQNLVNSPDLIPSQVRTLVNRYVQEMRELHATAVGLGSLSSDTFDIGPLNEESAIEVSLSQASKILDLKL
ncbi:MAG: hypothetical protein QNJ46_13780 [Leptolyngbyaceae cyanobacterium MO_188.B28]|nr:hypothetical protein [Leptolyngbyaceae cyanobacterium MO_188.B28]